MGAQHPPLYTLKPFLHRRRFLKPKGQLNTSGNKKEAVQFQFAGKGRESLARFSATNGRSSDYSCSLMGAQHPPLYHLGSTLKPFLVITVRPAENTKSRKRSFLSNHFLSSMLPTSTPQYRSSTYL
ncbi:hypothetical protein CDAR_518251 [Caerostris darwini]|uniref:Uncharacterized protein n=1 Tax=Caerostris darwini TaxID=1538125 RepID=A0AAV4RP77_9ARAC|nr:hypothetical protein CDAR_518251 [Caerostris darwini]